MNVSIFNVLFNLRVPFDRHIYETQNGEIVTNVFHS